MDWIKRNLFFVIGAAVALLLMVGAGYYTWTGWSQNSAALEEINGKYAELKRLINLNPNPGSGKVDNVKTAKAQQQQVAGVIAKVAGRFTPIAPIPPETSVTAEGFASGLATTIYRLQQDFTNAGVVLTPRYNFSFEQQSKAVRFAGSLVPLAVQLGEVNTIMEVLIAAKINSLESIQRERVSPDDMSGPANDYLDQYSETNELAILAPYQVTFRCFTPELALVLAGYAGASKGIIVKSVNVEPSADVYDPSQIVAQSSGGPIYIQPPVIPAPGYPGQRRSGEEGGEGASRRAFAERYGIGPRGPTTPQPQQPVYAQPTAPVATGPRTVLDEKQLRVTMLLNVVKLLPKN